MTDISLKSGTLRGIAHIAHRKIDMLNFKLFRIYFGQKVELSVVHQILHFYGIEIGRFFVGFMFVGKGE